MKKKNRNTTSAIVSFLFAVGFTALGIFAYSNGYYILLFRVIPLNGIAFAIIALILLGLGIFQLATAKGKDRKVVETFEQMTSQAQQAATLSRPLTSVCTINVKHNKGPLGIVNHLTIFLNGYEVGKIKTKGSLSFGTTVEQNELMVINSANDIPDRFNFTATDGGVVNLTVTITAFQAAPTIQKWD